MKLKLKTLDVETTGLDTQSGGDMTVQLCIATANEDGGLNVKKTSILPVVEESFASQVKAGTFSHYDIDGHEIMVKHMNPSAEAVHGISLASILDGEYKTIGDMAEKLASFVSDGYIIMYSGLFFDRIVLENELSMNLGRKVQFSEKIIDPYLIHLHFNPAPSTPEDLVDLVEANYEGYPNTPEGIRLALFNHFVYQYGLSHADIIGYSNIDHAVMALYRKENNNKLSTLYKTYFGEDMQDAHDAESDVRATYRLYMAMKEKYGFTDDEAVEITTHPSMARVNRFPGVQMSNGIPCLGFGKHKGTPLAELPDDYINWMMKKGVFDRYLLNYINYIKNL